MINSWLKIQSDKEGEALTVGKFKSAMARVNIDIGTGFFVNDYTEKDIEQLAENISKFDALTEEQVNGVDFEKKITDVMQLRGLLVYPNHYTECMENTTFFRVRSLDQNIDYKTQISKEQDCWNPPCESVKTLGRINQIGESLLYTVPEDLYTALDEAHINNGENCALIVYKAKKQIRLNMIGGKYRYKWNGISDDKQIRIYELLNSFLNGLFSKVVTDENLYWYRVTEKIAKDYFSPPDSYAWCYSSIKDPNRMNVCFNPKGAKQSLNLLGVCIIKRVNKREIELIDVIEKLSVSREQLLPMLTFSWEDVKYDYNDIFIDEKYIYDETEVMSADIVVAQKADERLRRLSMFTDEIAVDKEFRTCFYVGIALNGLNTVKFHELRVKLCFKMFNKKNGKWSNANLCPQILIRCDNGQWRITHWNNKNIFSTCKNLENSINLPPVCMESKIEELGLGYIEAFASLDKKEDIEIGNREIYVSQKL